MQKLSVAAAQIQLKCQLSVRCAHGVFFLDEKWDPRASVRFKLMSINPSIYTISYCIWFLTKKQNKNKTTSVQTRAWKWHAHSGAFKSFRSTLRSSPQFTCKYSRMFPLVLLDSQSHVQKTLKKFRPAPLNPAVGVALAPVRSLCESTTEWLWSVLGRARAPQRSYSSITDTPVRTAPGPSQDWRSCWRRTRRGGGDQIGRRGRGGGGGCCGQRRLGSAQSRAPILAHSFPWCLFAKLTQSATQTAPHRWIMSLSFEETVTDHQYVSV